MSSGANDGDDHRGRMIVIASRGPTDSRVISAVASELLNASDRAVGIVGGALLETCLQEAILRRLHPAEKITDGLFRVAGPLGSFSAKIDLGLLIGLYGQSAHTDLMTIKNIRNRFAHYLEVSSFSDEKITAWSKNLKFCEWYTVDAVQTDARKPTANIAIGKLADFALGAKDRDESLGIPRARFLMTISAMTYGLTIPHGTAMPAPKF